VKATVKATVFSVSRDSLLNIVVLVQVLVPPPSLVAHDPLLAGEIPIAAWASVRMLRCRISIKKCRLPLGWMEGITTGQGSAWGGERKSDLNGLVVVVVVVVVVMGNGGASAAA
jgi:hypothetical protein